MVDIHRILYRPVSIAPLTSFRVLFGFVMAVSIVRFASYGWISDLYVEPEFYFTYLGFDWVQPMGALGMYSVFGILLVSSIGICLGWHYRLCSVLFFILFTYVELIDKTNYLNHYYFVSLISFLLILLPANSDFSLDQKAGRVSLLKKVPSWCILSIMIQLGLVYFLAGLAKINSYWLLEAMPLKIWLPSKSGIAIIGPLLEQEFVAYVFSWTGALYDLTIVPLLLYKRTRVLAFIAVVIFHLLTALLFQIGMFPYIMILSSLIFFSGAWHELIQRRIKNLFSLNDKFQTSAGQYSFNSRPAYVLIVFFAIQCLIPFRHMAYPGDLFWTEEGYRFSWRVMLMEKAGHTTFRIEDEEGKKEWVQNDIHLTPQQEKMMSTQPDMILQFAHHLKELYANKGFINPKIYCNSKVSLNGRRSQVFIDPMIDLGSQPRDLHHKTWINSFQKESI